MHERAVKTSGSSRHRSVRSGYGTVSIRAPARRMHPTG
jgi:hypothetical protein